MNASIMLKNRHYPSKALINYVLRARHSSLDGSRNALKIALLIDGENADDSRHTAKFLEEAGRFGDITVKKLYADFTTPQMGDWNQKIDTYALDPVHRSASSSPDSALVIDAMDILHSHKVDGFCIVSSSSKYTGLAIRLRNAGLFVLGIGRPQTPESFVNACKSFIYSKEEQAQEVAVGVDGAVITRKHSIPSRRMILSKCDQVFPAVADKATGHALASRLCAALLKSDRALEYRALGYMSVGAFCESLRPNYVTFVGSGSSAALFIKRNDETASELAATIDDEVGGGSNEAAAVETGAAAAAVVHETTTTTVLSKEVVHPDAVETSISVGKEDQLLAEPVVVVVKEEESGPGYGDGDESVQASRSVHMKLVDRAFQAADSDRTGTVPVTSFWRAFDQVDSLFDYRKLGFLTFIEFCNSLQPEYVSYIGGAKNNVQYIRRNKSGLDIAQLPKPKEAAAAAAAPLAAAPPPLAATAPLAEAAPMVVNQNRNADSNATGDSSEGKSPHVMLVDRAFQTSKHERIIDLEYLQRTLEAWDPLFDHRKLGFSSFANFCRSLQPEYSVVTLGSDKTTTTTVFHSFITIAAIYQKAMLEGVRWKEIY